MTQEELIKEIERLPLDQKREILNSLSRSVGQQTHLPEEHTHLPEDRTALLDRLQGMAKPPDPAPGKVISDAGNGSGTLSQQLYGILQFEGGPPTDEEVKDMIADYLAKKYY